MRSRLRLKEGWSTYFLILVLHILVVWSLSAAEWAGGLGLLVWVALPAVTLGLAFAKMRRLPGVAAHIVSTLVGLAWTIVLVSFALRGQLNLKERVIALLLRFGHWLEVALGQGVSSDDVIFVLQLGVLLWVIAYLGAWFAFRRQEAWPAILPAGAVILVNSLYAPSGNAIYFILFLFCALLLIVRVHVLAEQVHWQKNRIAFAPDVALDFLRDGAILSILIVLSALLLPSAFANPRWNDIWDSFSKPWQTVQDEWARLYSNLSSDRALEAVSFGRTMALGGPVRLSDTPLMVVDSPRFLYWRAAVYDQYTGRGWLNSDPQTATWPAEEFWPVLAYERTENITQTVKPIRSGSFQFYAGGQPIWASVPVMTDLSYLPADQGGAALSGLAEPSVMRTLRGISPEDGYQVVSAVSTASAKMLRAAGASYPAWVSQKYLALPSVLPDRVVQLARQITEGAANPYEAGEVIESYLRREYKYDQSVEAPPLNADAVDYFLFESKAGYCDYYASAMVVLLRAVGIPARVASGYSGGAWDSLRKGYTVLYSDAHSWAEVYFPNYGWIVFEPTASEPLVARPSEEATGLIGPGGTASSLLPERQEDRFGADELAGEDAGEAAAAEETRVSLSVGIVAIIAAGGLLLLAALAGFLWWVLTLRRMKPAERLFARMAWLSRWAGIRRGTSETPREFALRLADSMGGNKADALYFADLYNRERFGLDRKVAVDKDAVRAHWGALWRALVSYQWRRIRAKLTIKSSPRVERVPVRPL